MLLKRYILLWVTILFLSFQWDLVCGNAYKASLSITLYFVGVMLGSLTFGLLSDKFGRRPVFLCTMTTPFFVGLPLLFTKNFTVFAALRLLLGFLIQVRF